MSGYNGYNASTNLDSIGLYGEDIPNMVGTGAIRFNTTTRRLELSNDGAAWLQIGAGPASSVSAGTNINITTVGGNSVISTVASPSFTDVTLGSTSLNSIASTVIADLDQSVKTTASPSFTAVNATTMTVGGVGHMTITDQNIQWPAGRMTFTRGLTSVMELGNNAIYLSDIHALTAGSLRLMDNLAVNTGVTIAGRDIATDGTTLDNTVTTVGTLNGYLDQAVKTTSSPTFAAVNTTAINSATQLSMQQKSLTVTSTNPYGSNSGEVLFLVTDPGSAVTTGSRIASIMSTAATGTTHALGSGSILSTFATQNWTPSANGSKFTVSTTPNNSTIQTLAATFDQDQSLAVVGKISWANALGSLSNVGVDPSITATNSLHINLNGSDQVIFNNGGTAYFKAFDALGSSGITTSNMVISTTGKAVAGGIRYNSTSNVLEYYNGTTWNSASTVTAGTNMSFSGTALGLISTPTISGLVTMQNGLTTSNTSTTTATGQFYNNATTSCASIWSIAPSLAPAQKLSMLHGQAGSTYNCGTMTFNYAGNGSAANSIGLGVFGNDNLLTVDATGNTNVVGNCTSGGSIKGNSASNSTAPVISQNNSTLSGTQYLGQFFSPSLPAGSKTQIQSGLGTSSNDCIILDFNYSASGSSNNTAFLGLYGSTQGLSVDGLGRVYTTTSTGGTQGLNVTNSGSAASIQLAQFVAPNTSSKAELWFGKLASNNDMAILDFNYASAGNVLNSIGLGFYGANNRLTVNANGDCVVSNNVTCSNIVSNTSALSVRPTTGSTSFDMYISSTPTDTTALQITSTSSAIYAKSKTSGVPINLQSWISGTPTSTLIVDDNGSYADYFQVGSNKKNIVGGIAMSSTLLQYYDGSAWNTLQKAQFQTFGTQVRVVNSAGTYQVYLIGSNHNLGGAYNVAFGGANTSVDITIPGSINSQYVVQWSGEQGYCTPPSYIRSTISGTSNEIVRLIPAYNTSGDVAWSSILPNSGDEFYFNVTIIAAI